MAAGALAHPALAQEALVLDTGSHALLGPRRAAGAIIWSHGRSLSREDSSAPTPFYIEVLRQQGWDALRLNRPRAADDLENSPAALVRAARQLKADGYRRVVLTGQSFGAFISLIAADLSDDVDAVIATAPAAYPPWGAWSQFNALKLYPILERVRRARVMLFYFQGDEFDPGSRGARSEEILTARRVPHLVVDQPPGFSTHWAATTDQFAAGYGTCIAAFALYDAAKGSLDCRTLELRDTFARQATPPTTSGLTDGPSTDGRAQIPFAGSAMPERDDPKSGLSAGPRESAATNASR